MKGENRDFILRAGDIEKVEGRQQKNEVGKMLVAMWP